MSETKTSNSGEFGSATAPEQKKNWIEIQLIDEQRKPVANMPYMADNDPTHRGEKPASYHGVSDANGIIRIEEIPRCTLILKIQAQPLADEMEQRPLNTEQRMSSETRKMNGFGIDEETGCIIYHVVIGNLCDKAPAMPWWDEQYKQHNKYVWEKEGDSNEYQDEQERQYQELHKLAQYPEYHFPDPEFSGLKIAALHFNARVLVEICPFRSWNLLLHNTKNYSIVNAYNQGLMANLTYSNSEDFFKFFNGFMDLSSIPNLGNGRQLFYPVVIDVPFSKSYKGAVFLDTAELLKDTPQSEGEVFFTEDNKCMEFADTQIFYIYGDDDVIVGWRGSQEFQDWLSDFTFRPIVTSTRIDDSKVPQQLLPEGFVHKGFWDAFSIAKYVFDDEFKYLLLSLKNKWGSYKSLYICGHSLGGALSLIYATELKAWNPILYTYGMPRTFTVSAIKNMAEIVHYRHVNDADMVTFVPPEAKLDNDLYDYFGTFFGFIASLTQWAYSKVVADSECFLHHGNVVVFFRAEQHYTCMGPTLDSDGGVYRKTQYVKALYDSSKFYLVPALDSGAYSQAEKLQSQYTRLFPPNANPDQDSFINPMHHLMGDKYIPFLNNQLLELCDPGREMQRKRKRERFINRIEPYEGPVTVCENERQRNLLFSKMQEEMSGTLLISESVEGGKNALLRFKTFANEDEEL